MREISAVGKRSMQQMISEKLGEMAFREQSQEHKEMIQNLSTAFEDLATAYKTISTSFSAFEAAAMQAEVDDPHLTQDIERHRAKNTSIADKLQERASYINNSPDVFVYKSVITKHQEAIKKSKDDLEEERRLLNKKWHQLNTYKANKDELDSRLGHIYTNPVSHLPSFNNDGL
jgi:hypothetical protein